MILKLQRAWIALCCITTSKLMNREYRSAWPGCSLQAFIEWVFLIGPSSRGAVDIRIFTCMKRRPYRPSSMDQRGNYDFCNDLRIPWNETLFGKVKSPRVLFLSINFWALNISATALFSIFLRGLRISFISRTPDAVFKNAAQFNSFENNQTFWDCSLIS